MYADKEEKRAKDTLYRQQNRELLAAKSRQYRQDNLERILEQGRKYRADNKVKLRRQKRARRYGLSLEQVIELESKTHCPICETQLDHEAKQGSPTGAAYDHCHDSMKFRDVICGSCNRMLGFAKDSQETLLKAAAYLQHHQEV